MITSSIIMRPRIKLKVFHNLIKKLNLFFFKKKLNFSFHILHSFLFLCSIRQYNWEKFKDTLGTMHH